MNEFKIQDGVLLDAGDKSAAYIEVPPEIKTVAAGAFSGFAGLCLADIYAEDVQGYIPADVLILHEGVKKLGADGEITKAEKPQTTGKPQNAEKPLSFVREYKTPTPVKGGAILYPIIVMPDSLCEFGGIDLPGGVTVIASEGSAAERFAKERGFYCARELKPFLAKQAAAYDRNIAACEKRAAAFRKDLADAQREHAELINGEDSRKQEERARLEREIAEGNERLERAKERAAELEKQVKEKEKQRTGAFFLDMRKKNELAAEIEELNALLTEKRLEVNTLPVKIHAAQVELDNPLANEKIKRAEERCRRLAEGAEHFERTAARLKELAKLLREREAKI